MNIAQAFDEVETAVNQVGGTAVALIPFIINTVSNIEAASKIVPKAGGNKMTDVLNAVSAFVSSMPQIFKDIEAFLKKVEDAVNALVSIWNEVGTFFHGAKPA